MRMLMWYKIIDWKSLFEDIKEKCNDYNSFKEWLQEMWLRQPLVYHWKSWFVKRMQKQMYTKLKDLGIDIDKYTKKF